MRSRKIFLVLIVLLFSLQICFAQEKLKAVLVNEAGKTDCEMLKVYTDSFTVEYANEPDARFFIVIRPNKKLLNYAIWQEKIINYRTYNYDPDRFKVVHAAPQDDYRIEFWKVPAGADMPDFKATDWNTPTDLSKPFLFGVGSEDDYCPTFIPELYAKLINQNPNVRGQIIINESKSFWISNRSSLLEEWVAPLTEKFNLPRNRFKLIFTNPKKSLTNVEYWIVPIKKNRRP